MRKLVILLAVICSIASCGKEEIYSCDPEANMWVKSNITEIQQMTRADFLAIGDIVYMRAAYAAFTSNQRQALWVGKLEEILKLDWSEQESHHIQSILNLIKENSFIFSKDRDQEAFDKVEVEIYRLSEYAQEELGWDNYLWASISATPQMLNEDKTINLVKSNLRTSSTLKSRAEGGICDCSIDSFDWCFFPVFRTCVGAPCESLGKCGTLWTYDCDGICI